MRHDAPPIDTSAAVRPRHRALRCVLCVVLALPLSGCVLRGKPKTVAAAPIVPTPAAQPAPQQPAPQQLSTPQTLVDLPPAQPVNPEALATAPPPELPAETPASPRPPRRTPVQASQPRPEPAPAQTQPAAQPPAEDVRPPVQALVPAEDQKKLQDSAQGRKREVSQILSQAPTQSLTARQKDIVRRIGFFVRQSDQAEQRGDMRQADDLAARAQALARELSGAR
jgi:hypothetical protein